MTTTETVSPHVCTCEKDERISRLAEKLGMTYEETHEKLIQDALRETYVSDRIVEKVTQFAETIDGFSKELYAKQKFDIALHFRDSVYTINTVLNIIREEINGA